MRALLHTEFTALLARAGVSQAAFARLAGVTPRQVNNWARGRAAVPKWAAVLAGVLAEFTPEALEIMIDDADFSWCETLGVPSSADPELARRAMTRLALAYHPDRGGTQDQMARINAAYAKARAAVEVP
ncbi:MAG TPA: helix-turn-helix domain-containing protein [Acetobacteraceae bacterium]|nr:helix-turn-helix domain-containing protein [Acetobacteraceae bacterium]